MGSNLPSQIRGGQNNDLLAYILSCLAGFVVCFAVTVVTGAKEAWDNSIYFTIGIPLMCVLVFVVSFKFPLNPWRWAVAQAVGQSIAISMAGNSFNLWPLSIIAMSILSLPQLAIALFASNLAKKKSVA